MIVDKTWDLIIVGTGIGGATLGYAMAKAGYSVLFCEKGRFPEGDSAILGELPDLYFPKPGVPTVKHAELLKRGGRAWEWIEDRSGPKSARFIPFIGAGAGGSSGLYGMVMERFQPSDFEGWPISYESMVPYYEMAERLYRVRPARAGEGLSATAQRLWSHFEQSGLQPYRLPVACEYRSDCRQDCQSILCRWDCKNDSARVALRPAINEFGATLLTECDVLTVLADHEQARGVECLWNGQTQVFRGKIIVLAAGGLETPCILLRSINAQWTKGLGNDSGLVGRNLMRHYIDLYALSVKGASPEMGNGKEIALNDYYLHAGEKYGTIQSFGTMLPARVIVSDLLKKTRWAEWLRPLLEWFIERIFSRRSIMATIMEDSPRVENRVYPPRAEDMAQGVRWILQYRIPKADRQRIEKFRKIVARIFRPYAPLLIKQAENNARIAHVCGTCRMGTDPGTSVLDSNNRVHAVKNLYATDASFFPSSGGINPALTIAANALRVAEHLKTRLNEGEFG